MHDVPGGSTLLTALRRRKRTAAAGPAAVDKTSLVDYWNLDEASGNRAGSHAGLTLTDNNTVTSQATGSPAGGRCAQFTSASSEYLSRASQVALQTGDIDFTLCAWVYLDTDANGVCIAKNDNGTATEFELLYIAALKRFRFTIDGSAAVAAATFGDVPIGAWCFVVAWHDATANTISIAVNGGSADSAAEGTPPAANNVAFQLGARNGPALNFNGRMWAVSMWKRVLTADERSALYNGGSGRLYASL